MTSAHVRHSDAGDPSGSIARTAHSTGYEPILSQHEGGANFMSPADGGDEDLKGIENLQFGQAPACLAPEEYGLESVWGDRGTVHRAAQRRRVHGDVPVPQQGHPDNTQNLFHQVRDDWRSQSYRALHYQHEQFEIAVQEQQREAFDQVEIAVALATSRTAVQMTSRFRDIENHVEANFSYHQTEFLSQNTSLSVRALEAQRHTLVQEPTAEMIRRDAHSAEVLSHFGNELQRYHLHAEVQSDEFQHSQTELNQYLERANTEGSQ